MSDTIGGVYLSETETTTSTIYIPILYVSAVFHQCVAGMRVTGQTRTCTYHLMADVRIEARSPIYIYI